MILPMPRTIVFLTFAFLQGVNCLAQPASPALANVWSGQGCTSSGCHLGIEPIRELNTGMMRQIMARGKASEDPDGCTVCHGGDPSATAKAVAHKGARAQLSAVGGPNEFYADPGSPWVNPRTCGQCHKEWVRAEWASLMMTESGKVQGTAWAFGALEGYDHGWANYFFQNPASSLERIGTEIYRAYMDVKTKEHPNVFTKEQHVMPEALKADELDRLKTNPELAAFTYLRTECQRCHLGVKGRNARGDFRGMGCSACHIPYGVEGLYEGTDKTIKADQPGHLLVHSIQGSRNAKVRVGTTEYSGIPVGTCTVCHNRGKRIGVSYQGLMESGYESPFTEGGGGQLPLHSKQYLGMTQDIHAQKGMLCQDCHTSGDVHGDGFTAGTDLGGIEIECADCHGTPLKFPWELPLGFGDENHAGPAQGPPRGVAKTMMPHLAPYALYPAQDGFILSARGNPMPDVVRVGNRIVLHTAAGKDLWIEPLKLKMQENKLSVAAKVAMGQVTAHMDKMECYACHATWAPQCYGCHVKVDYSKDQKAFDWVAAGHEHEKPEFKAVKGESTFNAMIPGKVTEQRSYLRWEDPALGINGEGRVSPMVPGCQVSVTVIGADGKEIIRNKIFRTPGGMEGSGPEGQLSIDTSPIQPHTIGKPRSCESCHSSDKAFGYGIGGGALNAPWNKPLYKDLATADGKVIPGKARPQIEPIEGLDHDWSAFVTPDGKQTATVDHHWKGAGPLSQETRLHMDRRNVCLGCHREIPAKGLKGSLEQHASAVVGKRPVTSAQHESLLHALIKGRKAK